MVVFSTWVFLKDTNYIVPQSPHPQCAAVLPAVSCLYKDVRQGISTCLIMILLVGLSNPFRKYDIELNLNYNYCDSIKYIYAMGWGNAC